MADSSAWQPVPMQRGEDGWSLSCIFPETARSEYTFIVNGQQVLDPLNPYWVPGPFGPHSECRMPGYVAPPPIEPPQEGFLERMKLGDRMLDLYVPPIVE